MYFRGNQGSFTGWIRGSIRWFITGCNSARYRLRWNSLQCRWARISLQTCSLAVDPSSQGEVDTKQSVTDRRTEAVSPLIMYMTLAMTGQLEMHWPVAVRSVKTDGAREHIETLEYTSVLRAFTSSNSVISLVDFCSMSSFGSV